MLHLEDKREVRFFRITGTKRIEVKRILKIILEEYDDIISQGAYDIGNCHMIKYIIRLLDETLIVEKQGYQSLKKYE